MLVGGGSFEITLIFALSTSSPAPDTLCPKHKSFLDHEVNIFTIKGQDEPFSNARALTSWSITIGIKILLNAASITAAHIRVNAAQLCLLKEFELLKWDQQVVLELVALRNFARRYGSRFCTYGGCIQSSHAQTGQPNSPQLAHEDLQQIHPDDIEEMDLRCPKWSATTAIRGDILLGSVELQEIKTTRTRKAQEGSDQAEEGPNYALMAYSSSSSDSEVSNDSNCSKSCMETVKLLKSQNDQLLRDLARSAFSSKVPFSVTVVALNL
ncbi:hypothetical protein Tco_1218019 [Tanacetum coccineum]